MTAGGPGDVELVGPRVARPVPARRAEGDEHAGARREFGTRQGHGSGGDAPEALQCRVEARGLFDGRRNKDIAQRWESRPVTARREIAALLLSPEVMGQVRIKRVADSASEAVEDRIRWVEAE